MIHYTGNRAENIKIAYIGGGSRGWAWGLMSDLAMQKDISGEVVLYDIDLDAARANEIIGNRIPESEKDCAAWRYRTAETIDEALEDADFVIISILPGTFHEMESDVHAPEKYGIYQSVGDTTGPGGILRALRAIPMFETIAHAIAGNCPEAWVINYTNPMSMLMRTLYRVFPRIKAFGCCHEVFGTQNFLASVVREELGIEAARDEIKVNVVGINHFTWLTEARFRDQDLYPVYRRFCRTHAETGYIRDQSGTKLDDYFKSCERVKMDLFLRYGVIAAAGDRHLAEFVPGKWYLKDPQTVEEWKFKLTPVSYRFGDLEKRMARSARLRSGEESFTFAPTGEEGVRQIRAILGLDEFVTNVNLPNRGQIPNLPDDAIVETNAHFRAGTVRPVFAGLLPESIYPLVAPIVGEQEQVVDAALSHDLDKALRAFLSDPLVTIGMDDARALFTQMCRNTKDYLRMYGVQGDAARNGARFLQE